MINPTAAFIAWQVPDAGPTKERSLLFEKEHASQVEPKSE